MTVLPLIIQAEFKAALSLLIPVLFAAVLITPEIEQI